MRKPAASTKALRVLDVVSSEKDENGKLTARAAGLRSLLKAAGYTPNLTGAKRNEAVMAFKSHVPFVCTFEDGKQDNTRFARVCTIPNGDGKEIAIYTPARQGGAAAVTATLAAVNRGTMAQTTLEAGKYYRKIKGAYEVVTLPATLEAIRIATTPADSDAE